MGHTKVADEGGLPDPAAAADDGVEPDVDEVAVGAADDGDDPDGEPVAGEVEEDGGETDADDSADDAGLPPGTEHMADATITDTAAQRMRLANPCATNGW